MSSPDGVGGKASVLSELGGKSQSYSGGEGQARARQAGAAARASAWQ